MLITGLINLFVNYVDRKDGTNFPTFSTTISTKIKDSEENEVRKIYLFVNKATLKGRKEINKTKTKKSTGNDDLPF